MRTYRIQFVGFVAVGAAASVVSLTVRYFINAIAPYELAVTIAQLVGMGIAFSLNKTLIFRNSGRSAINQLTRFTMVNMGSLLLAVSVSSIAYRILLKNMPVEFHPDFIAHFIGLSSTAIPSFLAHKHFSFGKE
jgi:putative flippase GtrA